MLSRNLVGICRQRSLNLIKYNKYSKPILSSVYRTTSIIPSYLQNINCSTFSSTTDDDTFDFNYDNVRKYSFLIN